MKKSISFLLLFSFLLNSCSTIKSVLILSKAKVNGLNEKKTFTYESSFSLIILTVKIKGVPYRFVFDTGANATLISKEVATAIGLKEVSSIFVKDAHKSSQKLSVGYVDTISLGDLQYAHVGVLVNDFKNSPDFSCLHIDGILGSNAITLNNWQIDYENQSVTVYDINSKMRLAENFKSIDFTLVNGEPRVDFSINGVKENFLIDTGDNDAVLSVSSKVKMNEPAALIVGYSASGLFDVGFDTTKLYKVNSFNNPQLNLSDILVSQAKSLGSLIGTGFFQKNYSSIAFDFKTNKLFVQEKSNKDNSTKDNRHLSYGFSPKLLTNNLVVGSKYLNFSEEITNLTIGDTISEINNISVINPCEILSELEKSKMNTMPIILKISKNKAIKSYTLSPKSIIP